MIMFYLIVACNFKKQNKNSKKIAGKDHEQHLKLLIHLTQFSDYYFYCFWSEIYVAFNVSKLVISRLHIINFTFYSVYLNIICVCNTYFQILLMISFNRTIFRLSETTKYKIYFLRT